MDVVVNAAAAGSTNSKVSNDAKLRAKNSETADWGPFSFGARTWARDSSPPALVIAPVVEGVPSASEGSTLRVDFNRVRDSHIFILPTLTTLDQLRYNSIIRTPTMHGIPLQAGITTPDSFVHFGVKVTNNERQQRSDSPTRQVQKH